MALLHTDESNGGLVVLVEFSTTGSHLPHLVPEHLNELTLTDPVSEHDDPLWRMTNVLAELQQKVPVEINCTGITRYKYQHRVV